MHTELLPAILLPGLLALYFWRESRAWTRRAASEPSAGDMERRYKEIFDNASDGIFVVETLPNGKFRFESLNSAAAEMIAPPGAVLAGRTFDQLVGRRRHSGLTSFLQELQRWLGVCASGGLPAGYEWRFGSKSDKLMQLQVRLTPMADDNGISHIICFLHDITARKNYEQELQERLTLEERVSAFAASAPGFFYSYRHGADGSNAMPFASTGIGELFGLRPESVALSIAPMNMLIHQDDMQAYIEALAHSAANLSPLQVEFRVMHPQRGELWVESRALPRSEADGGIVWHGFMHDISGRKLSEVRLREAQQFIEDVIGAISDPVFVKDRRHCWLMLNDAFCELIGHPREALIGKSDYDFFPKEEADEFWRGDDRVFATGQEDLNEEAFTDAEGKTRYIQTKKTLLQQNGTGYLIGVIRDITERRKMEDELRRKREILAEAQRIGRMGSWELDVPSGKLSWSDEIYRIFEIDPAIFEASYEAFLNAIHPEDRDAVDSAYRESMENRTPYCIDHRLLFPDGRIKHVRECCETHYDGNGSALRSSGTVQDITELKETQLRLLDTQERLRELVISRESLVEGERKRIAWEMHEELGQLLAAIRLRVNAIRNLLPQGIPAIDENNRAVDMLIDKSIRTVLDIVSELRPTVLAHGPVAALEWLLERCGEQFGISCALSVEEDGTMAGEELTLLVFRIAQEIIDSIARHVDVHALQVVWECSRNGCRLFVRHDVDVIRDGFAGITQPVFFSIRERISAFGGEMELFDETSGGGAIEVRFPLDKKGGGQYPLFVR